MLIRLLNAILLLFLFLFSITKKADLLLLDAVVHQKQLSIFTYNLYLLTNMNGYSMFSLLYMISFLPFLPYGNKVRHTQTKKL